MHPPENVHQPWNVLNAGGRDPAQDFAGGPGSPDDAGAPHPPVNYHGYAACTRGTFHARLGTVLASERPVLLLLRRDLGAGLRVLRRLQAAGRTVAVTFKEAGAVQIAARLGHANDLRTLKSILETAAGFLAPTLALQEFLLSLTDGRTIRHAFVPTPYPVDDPRWDFAQPAALRRGIFIGTREFDTPSRQHLAAVLAARSVHGRTGARVTVINAEGRPGSRVLRELGFSTGSEAGLRFVDGPLKYTVYLREMAGHQVVFQLDRSGVPGQVAGDALLCRLPCLGGDGAIEGQVFPLLSGHRHGRRELAELLEAFVREPGRCAEAVAAAQAAALESVSFGVGARRLAEFSAALATAEAR